MWNSPEKKNEIIHLWVYLQVWHSLPVHADSVMDIFFVWTNTFGNLDKHLWVYLLLGVLVWHSLPEHADLVMDVFIIWKNAFCVSIFIPWLCSNKWENRNLCWTRITNPIFDGNLKALSSRCRFLQWWFSAHLEAAWDKFVENHVCCRGSGRDGVEGGKTSY